MNLTSSILYW